MSVKFYIPKYLGAFVYRVLVLLARILGVPQIVLSRAGEVYEQQSAYYAAGMLWWFTKLQLGFRPPSYNVYQFFTTKEQKEFVATLLRPKIEEYRVAKQFYLLDEDDIENPEFLRFVCKTLNDIITKKVQTTIYKKNHYSTEKALHALTDVNNLFRKHGSRLFLVSGTLLGFVRDGGPIVGDNDIDLGVFEDDKNIRSAMDALQNVKWARYVNESRNFIQIAHANGMLVDIFIHYIRDGKVWHGTDIHRWHNTPFELVEADFGPLTVFKPANHERYLTENYGKWEDRVLFWDYSFDTPNREYAQNRKSILFLVERSIRGMGDRHPDRYLSQTALHALQKYFGIEFGKHLGAGTFLSRKDLTREG